MVYLTFLFDLLTVLVRFFNWLHSVGDEVTGMVLDMEVVKMADIVLDIEDDKMADMAVDMGVDMAGGVHQRGSHSLRAPVAWKTKSSWPEGAKAVGPPARSRARGSHRLLVFNICPI